MKGLLAAALLSLAFSAQAVENKKCLASALYHEARGEPLEGQRAVLDVILNRMKATGKTACQVVKAKKQFSWYPKKPIFYNKKLEEMLTRVKNAPRILATEKFFYSGKKKPKWVKDMLCRRIGNHKFCKEKRDTMRYELDDDIPAGTRVICRDVEAASNHDKFLQVGKEYVVKGNYINSEQIYLEGCTRPWLKSRFEPVVEKVQVVEEIVKDEVKKLVTLTYGGVSITVDPSDKSTRKFAERILQVAYEDE